MQLKYPVLVALGCAASFFSGCATPAQNMALGATAAAAVGGITPSNQLEQTYYFGLLDPLQQIEPTLYRVRVRGQGSAISRMKFGSGWVPADLIDPLGTEVRYEKGKGAVQKTDSALGKPSELELGRRMIHFGPDGFREAPAKNRLVIVMGASPETFFQQIDLQLGAPPKPPESAHLNAAIAAALAEASAELIALRAAPTTPVNP